MIKIRVIENHITAETQPPLKLFSTAPCSSNNKEKSCNANYANNANLLMKVTNIILSTSPHIRGFDKTSGCVIIPSNDNIITHRQYPFFLVHLEVTGYKCSLDQIYKELWDPGDSVRSHGALWLLSFRVNLTKWIQESKLIYTRDFAFHTIWRSIKLRPSNVKIY